MSEVGGQGGRGRLARALARLLAVVLVLAGCGAASRPAPRPAAPTHDFGRLAGYVWTGQVSSVDGAWLVPGIATGSPLGHGSTWIGAQVGGPSARAPFIQVGITEDRARSSAGEPVSLERAFWSATSLGFHPHFLWTVRAGDTIRAALALLPSARWRIDIADLASGRRSTFTTGDDARGSFAVAEWLQEDPTGSDGSRLPYPRLAPTRFVALHVNGNRPLYRDVAAQWMSLHGLDLAPSPLQATGFSIAPAALSPPGMDYLRLVKRADHAIDAFDTTAATWRQSTPPRAIVAAADQLAAALARFEIGLTTARWPPPARRAVAALRADLRHEVGILRAAPLALRQPTAWTAHYSSAALTTGSQSRQVRRRLHLPELAGAGPG